MHVYLCMTHSSVMFGSQFKKKKKEIEDLKRKKY